MLKITNNVLGEIKEGQKFNFNLLNQWALISQGKNWILK